MIIRMVMLFIATIVICVSINVPSVNGHIGEPCNSLLKMCLPPTPHIFCDKSNICRCKPEYPVEIKPHSCKKAKKVGERCSFHAECTYSDSNSFCTQTPVSSECQCHDGFRYHLTEERCVESKGSKPRIRSSESIFFPSIIGFLLASFAVFCCFLFFWHSFCRKPPNDWSDPLENRLRVRIPPSDPNNTSASDRNNRISSSSTTTRSNRGSTLPPYTSSLYDQPPPSYEEAIKSSTNDSNQMMITESTLIINPPQNNLSSSHVHSSNLGSDPSTHESSLEPPTSTTSLMLNHRNIVSDGNDGVAIFHVEESSESCPVIHDVSSSAVQETSLSSEESSPNTTTCNTSSSSMLVSPDLITVSVSNGHHAS